MSEPEPTRRYRLLALTPELVKHQLTCKRIAIAPSGRGDGEVEGSLTLCETCFAELCVALDSAAENLRLELEVEAQLKETRDKRVAKENAKKPRQP